MVSAYHLESIAHLTKLAGTPPAASYRLQLEAHQSVASKLSDSCQVLQDLVLVVMEVVQSLDHDPEFEISLLYTSSACSSSRR